MSFKYFYWVIKSTGWKYSSTVRLGIVKVPDNLQLQLINLQFKKVYKNNFNGNNLNLLKHKLSNLRNFAKSMICVFSSTYL